jgi:hypothetical protein
MRDNPRSRYDLDQHRGEKGCTSPIVLLACRSRSAASGEVFTERHTLIAAFSIFS